MPTAITGSRLGRRGALAVFGAVSLVAALVLGVRVEPSGPQTSSPTEGTIAFDVRDARTVESIPCKITFVPAAGRSAPLFTKNDVGREEGPGIVAAYDRVMSVEGRGRVRVPTGAYDVYVSRGPEWTVATQRGFQVTAAGARLSARLDHVVHSDGWLSADFHVHAAPSPDSIVPLHHRVIDFVSEGVEMLVSTDHNVISDYRPTIHDLNADGLILSAMGDEVTTADWGHFGAFPLVRDDTRVGQGAVVVHGRTPKAIFADVHERAPHAIIDVHHPRHDPKIGYFSAGQLDPRSDRASRRGFCFDFDALEVLNGYQLTQPASLEGTLGDWFELLDHGHLVTATGNSDTHQLTANAGGYPRNYVRVRDDRPDAVSVDEVAAAVRDHHAFFTTGPFVRLSSAGQDIGDLVPAPDGRANVHIEVEAAPWIAVDRVTLYINGRAWRAWEIAARPDVIRFDEEVEVPMPRDGYVVVRVEGDTPLWPIVGDRSAFVVRPLAVTNPIFFDADGNGRFDAEHARPRGLPR